MFLYTLMSVQSHMYFFAQCKENDDNVNHTCVSTGAVSLGSLLVFNSQPTATQMKISLNEALDVAATTSPVIMLCMLDPRTGKEKVFSSRRAS